MNGDQICSEPALRFALKNFKNKFNYLATNRPEFFQHLQFKKVYDLRKADPAWEYHLYFPLMRPVDTSNISWQFLAHLQTHCVDYPSICAFRSQLPNKDKEIILKPNTPTNPLVLDLPKTIVLHPGRSWPTKTFPPDFWQAVINEIIKVGIKPAVIGADVVITQDTYSKRGIVNELDLSGCINLTNKMPIMDTVWYLQRSPVLLTSDSSPLHMAASQDSDCWIGFIATAKHPDLITHWRKGQFGWRMKNFSKSGCWDYLDYSPHIKQGVDVSSVPEETLRSWLPDPVEYAQWAIDKYHDYLTERN